MVRRRSRAGGLEMRAPPTNRRPPESHREQNRTPTGLKLSRFSARRKRITQLESSDTARGLFLSACSASQWVVARPQRSNAQSRGLLLQPRIETHWVTFPLGASLFFTNRAEQLRARNRALLTGMLSEVQLARLVGTTGRAFLPGHQDEAFNPG
jgi:hypothetical protein